MSLAALALATAVAAGDVPTTCDASHPVSLEVLREASDTLALARLSKTQFADSWGDTYSAAGSGQFWVQPYSPIKGPLPKGRLKFDFSFLLNDDSTGYGIWPGTYAPYLVRRTGGQWYVYDVSCIEGLKAY